MEEVCPSCGAFTYEIDPITGWCQECTSPVVTFIVGMHNFYVTRLEQWYARHADLLDRLLAQGFTPKEARSIVQFTSTKAICIRCNTVFRKGVHGESLFCRQNQLCKTAARRYRYLREEKRLSRQQAIERVTANG